MADERTWLQEQLAQYQHDVEVWEAHREALDNDVIRPLRPQFREMMREIIESATLEEARIRAQDALDTLAQPGPAHSVAKDLHTATRRFGTEAKHILNQHVNDIEQRLS